MDQRSGDGCFFGRVDILAISLWKGFSKLRDAGREDCLCSEQDHLEFPVQEEGQPLLSMSKIPSDDILERLYKLRIRESAQLKTVLDLYDMEIHQKVSMLNNQKLKTMVKRRKDQKLRLRNFDARHGRIESRAVVKKGINRR